MRTAKQVADFINNERHQGFSDQDIAVSLGMTRARIQVEGEIVEIQSLKTVRDQSITFETWSEHTGEADITVPYNTPVIEF
mgnify:CR=1 FL=1